MNSLESIIMYKIIKNILVIFLGIPIAVFVRIVKPLILIRFGYFYGPRIGHFSFDVEYYLGEREQKKSKSLDIFFISKPISNHYFVKLISRKIILFSPIALAFYANKYFSDYKIHEYIPAIVSNGTRDLNGYISNTKNHLHFTEEENIKGHKFLESLGSLNSNKFVCLNIRDSAYLKSQLFEYNFNRGNYRDSDINTYKKTIKFLTESGYFVLRMGKLTEKSIVNFSGFYDYSNSNKRTEFLDIWLMANCHFAISTSSGLDSVCNIFRRPVAFVNSLPISHIPEWNPKSIFTPKNIINNKTGQKLVLSEIIQKDLIGYTDGTDYIDKLKKRDCALINNDENEILETVKEIIKNINSNWKEGASTEDQKAFWNLLKNWKDFSKNFNINNFPYVGSISNNYLSKNKNWFLK